MPTKARKFFATRMVCGASSLDWSCTQSTTVGSSNFEKSKQRKSPGNTQARTRLELVLKRHATTPSAVEARTLLESLR